MDSVGKDQHGRPANPSRPVSPFALPPPQGRPPLRSPGAVSSGPEMSGVPRTVPPSYPGPVTGAQTSIPRFAMPVGFDGPSSSPVPMHVPSSLSQIPAQQFPPSTLVGYPQHAPSSASKNVPPLHVAQAQFSPVAGSHSSPAQPMVLPHAPSVPLGPPPVIRNEVSQRGNMPQLQTVGNIPPPQPPLSGYTMPPSSLSSSYSASKPFASRTFQQNLATQPNYSYNSQQGRFPRPPPTVLPNAGFVSREQPHPTSGPPLGSMLQGLVEEFTSLSVNSSPGSVDPGIDFHSLPRPLDSDMEPKKIVETYPLNCHPRYFRLTSYAVPSSQSLLARWHLPFGATVHPLAEAPDGEEVPVVNFGSAGIIRCRRCRTYVNPYVTFTDAGRKWRCNLCSLLNDVPGEYFSILDASGRRCDLEQRPELTKGSVEFVAPTEYMVRPPMPPLYFFLIDVSVSAVRSGMLEIVAKTIKSCLDVLPGYPRTQIGFLTFDSTLHFYNLKSSLTQPQMMVVADLDDTFVPLPDDLLVNLSDSRNVVDAFLDSLLTMFQDNANVESALGPALKAAFMVMSQLGGKLLVFQATLPSLGIGRLKLRGDDMRIYGTDKEHTLRIPEDPFYKQMAAEFTKFQIGVDIYAFSDKYSDIASLGSLAKYTGGQVYYYPSFISSLHQDQLKNDLARDLTRETAWESVMRIRCGKGVRFTTYHGHFMLRSTDLLALPAVDCDKAFAMQLSLEDTLMTTQTVYFQVALLYTSSSGERRIRVHTAAAPVVTDLSVMYRQADIGAIFSLLSRLAIEKTLTQKLEDARQFLQLRIIKSLKEYRNLYVVQHRLGGRFIFPESLKLLPLYGLALCKSLALRGGYSDALLDERCAAGFTMMILPAKRILKLLYPSLTKIDDTSLESKSYDDLDLLKSFPLTASALDPGGLYLYNNGFQFVIWIGRMLSPNVVTSILGAKLDSVPDLSKVTLAEHENSVSKNLRKLLGRLREGEHACHRLCHIVRQGEQPRESMLLLNNLIEDQIAGTSGYLEWIVQLYRQTQ